MEFGRGQGDVYTSFAVAGEIGKLETNGSALVAGGPILVLRGRMAPAVRLE
jgi:hypothetical protein